MKTRKTIARPRPIGAKEARRRAARLIKANKELFRRLASGPGPSGKT